MFSIVKDVGLELIPSLCDEDAKEPRRNMGNISRWSILA